MRIVTLGGGTGQGQLLRGLAGLGVSATGIVGVTDNGGHSGHLRRELGIPAVGDLRNCLRAASPDSPLARFLDVRFAGGESAGNLLLAGLLRQGLTLSGAAARLGRRLGALADVRPVSDAAAQVAGELADGRRIVGEWDLIRRSPRSPIVRMYHAPALPATRAALDALRGADLVVLAPGSLRTGIVSILLATGVRAALRRARVVQVLNILTQPGQTDGFSAADHVAEVARYLGRRPDVVLANTARPPAWALEGAEFVDPAGIDAVRADLLERISRAQVAGRRRPGAFVAGPHLVRHDPARIARAVLSIARRSPR